MRQLSIAVLVLCTTLAAGSALARDASSFAPGSTTVDFGLGPSGSNQLYGSAAFWRVTAEAGVAEHVSIGGFYGGTGTHGNTALTGVYDIGYMMYGGRASYHFGGVIDDPRIDLYAGASLGRQSLTLRQGTRSVDVAELAGASWIYGAHLGARYDLGERMGVFAEGTYFQTQDDAGLVHDVTYGPGELSGGITLKF